VSPILKLIANSNETTGVTASKEEQETESEFQNKEYPFVRDFTRFLIEEEDDGQEQNEDSGQLSVQQRENNNFIEQSLKILNLDDFYEIKDRLFSKSREL
jgi:hypothetical protein